MDSYWVEPHYEPEERTRPQEEPEEVIDRGDFSDHMSEESEEETNPEPPRSSHADVNLGATVPLTEAAIAALQMDFPPPPAGQGVSPPKSEAGASIVSSASTLRGGQTRCTGPECKFSRKVADQPCRVHKAGEKCLWCDPAKLQAALESEAGRQRIRQSLNAFQRLQCEALALALAKLPADFQRSHKLCIAPGCCFSRAAPGRAARVEGNQETCAFCTFTYEGILVAETTGYGHRNLQQSLGVFAQRNQEVLQQAWGRLSADFRHGSENFQAWRVHHQEEQARMYRERQAILERERTAMGKEDFKNASKIILPQGGVGDRMLAHGPYWCLNMPRQTCAHPREDRTIWKCEMNAEVAPPCPPCRICEHGYSETDDKPEFGSHYMPAGNALSALTWESKPEEEKQAWYKYQRDLDLWEEAQPRGFQMKRQRYPRMQLEFERAAKHRKELGLPSQAELDVQGLFGPPSLDIAAPALAASSKAASSKAASSKAKPKAKRATVRSQDPDDRWYFPREREALMRRMGWGEIADAQLRHHGLPVPEDDGFDPDRYGDWFE